MTTLQRPERTVRPAYRHAEEVPAPWVEQMLNPLGWKVGHWAMFVAWVTLAADIIAGLYLFNFFGLGRQFELQMWLLIAGILGFIAITMSLYAIVFRSGRGAGVIALLFSLAVGAAPAWLVGNTILQLIINGGQLPSAPIDW
ncbi:hypothetical protein EG850_10795 [Gulosibacter macacae]|uniref:Uncharacterized protein n=1 Tax=Gulosibacter macacae TaxID=2488791 RepID=A0A3P3VU78_9MICO|nr:hypothetical protein [Gulosibacter macacae]RRJ86014.1 hypothetical protein EG850_10795 [Gulosibacter macacae]